MSSRLVHQLIALTLGVACAATSAKELKLADFQPPTHPYVANVYAPLQAEVKDKTGGQLSVRLYMGGELGAGPAEQFTRAVNGVADIAFALPGYTAANFPKTLLTELPGVIDPVKGTERVLANLGQPGQGVPTCGFVGPLEQRAQRDPNGQEADTHARRSEGPEDSHALAQRGSRARGLGRDAGIHART